VQAKNLKKRNNWIQCLFNKSIKVLPSASDARLRLGIWVRSGMI